MDQSRNSDLSQYLQEWSQDLELLRQVNILNAGNLINFAKDRGMDISRDIFDEFYSRGWIMKDGEDNSGAPLFHPFRVYPIYHTLLPLGATLTWSPSLNREVTLKNVEQWITSLPDAEQVETGIQRRNCVINLPIILEPVYWPQITNTLRYPGGMSEEKHNELRNQYRDKVLDVIRELDPNQWREVHRDLRCEAEWLDQNNQLYLFLRLSKWTERERIKGRLSGALWLRQIAEVLRRAFEEAYSERWAEEDQAFGTWAEGARKRQYGSDRPLDDEPQTGPYLVKRYGLLRGSVLRWYVEGETEYHSILHILPDPARTGIELVNLHGVIKADKDNIALKLGEWFREDKAFRRFSMISFDIDVKRNVKAILEQMEKLNVPVYRAAHNPDFEFANFTLQELVEVAARLDESRSGGSGEAIRNANWTSITSGGAFERHYKKVSIGARGLKGKDWGVALASYMIDHPDRSDNGQRRPFWREINAALMGRIADYDLSSQHTELI